jgi:hypothetical protein
MTAPHPLTVHLDGDAMEALWKVSREDFPGYSLEALGAKLIRDELVRMAVLKLPSANRSKHAGRPASIDTQVAPDHKREMGF